MSDAPSVPKLACSPDGPYYLFLEAEPTEVPFLRRANGEACTTVRGVALCRCGGSANKPFCDGTHLPKQGETSRKSYVGRQLTILDDRSMALAFGHSDPMPQSASRGKNATGRRDTRLPA